MNCILINPADIDGNKVVIEGDTFLHITSVIKPSAGDTLKIGIVNGMIGSATVSSIEKSSLLLTLGPLSEPPAAPDIIVICALPRPKSFKKVLSNAIELGVKKFYFIESWRVEKSYWGSPVIAEASTEMISIKALEQARDTMMPRIEFRRKFKPFVEDELPALITNRLALLAHPYNSEPLPGNTSGSSVIVFGPEGGFIDYEVKKFLELKFKPINLGARILRVENAVSALLGRLLF